MSLKQHNVSKPAYPCQHWRQGVLLMFWQVGPDAAICAAAGGQDKAGIDREDCEALERAVRGLLLEQSMRRQRQQASAAEALFTGRREAGITFSRRKVCMVAG